MIASLSFCPVAKAPSRQAANRRRNSVRFAHFGPSHNLLRPA